MVLYLNESCPSSERANINAPKTAGVHYLGISELGERVHNDTKDDVQADCGDQDEEGHVKNCHVDGLIEVVVHQGLKRLLN